MKIELLFFAQIKEAFGNGGETIEVSEGATVEQVVETLRGREQWEMVASLPLSFAVNERIVDGRFTLSPGDRLALLTPISGG